MKRRIIFLSIILALILSIAPIPGQWSLLHTDATAADNPYLYSRGEDNVTATEQPTQEPEKQKSVADSALDLGNTLLKNNKVNIAVLFILCIVLGIIMFKNGRLKD